MNGNGNGVAGMKRECDRAIFSTLSSLSEFSSAGVVASDGLFSVPSSEQCRSVYDLYREPCKVRRVLVRAEDVWNSSF